jgi:hypothetical protein
MSPPPPNPTPLAILRLVIGSVRHSLDPAAAVTISSNDVWRGWNDGLVADGGK